MKHKIVICSVAIGAPHIEIISIEEAQEIRSFDPPAIPYRAMQLHEGPMFFKAPLTRRERRAQDRKFKKSK